MKTTLLILFCFLANSVFAQKWCLPGSEWKYTFESSKYVHGFEKWKISIDTTILGKPCKKLIGNKITYVTGPFPSGPSYSHIKEPIFTYESQDTVYMLIKEAFEPVYYFNAKVGDTILVGKFSSPTPKPKLVIYKIETKIINSIPVKYFYANFTQNINKNNSNYVYAERAGNLTTSMYPVFFYGDVFTTFCAYNDDIIAINPSADCGLYVASTNLLEDSLTISPNPSYNYINVSSSFNDKIKALIIYDIQGKMILYKLKNLNIQLFNLDVSSISNGLYILQIQTEDGENYVRKFVKQDN